jgi:hypothetical protein
VILVLSERTLIGSTEEVGGVVGDKGPQIAVEGPNVGNQGALPRQESCGRGSVRLSKCGAVDVANLFALCCWGGFEAVELAEKLVGHLHRGGKVTNDQIGCQKGISVIKRKSFLSVFSAQFVEKPRKKKKNTDMF